MNVSITYNEVQRRYPEQLSLLEKRRASSKVQGAVARINQFSCKIEWAVMAQTVSLGEVI